VEFEEGGEILMEDFWIEGLVLGKSRSYLTGLRRREEGEGQKNQRKREMPAPYRSSGGFLGNSAAGWHRDWCLTLAAENLAEVTAGGRTKGKDDR
jgi:hypothetical protein